ncbi:hypothetical protein GDO81_023805 [Engystomops pustulosus]|uniref:Uncharacterized protein n=1 Tax=Engystomops pustulosus TaxID=76066 RepID=A0AAV6ZS52_ENGPU|nr:hypothetical protein GDO81_023805 [Engystomops pustulosus]
MEGSATKSPMDRKKVQQRRAIYGIPASPIKSGKVKWIYDANVIVFCFRKSKISVGSYRGGNALHIKSSRGNKDWADLC